MTGTYSLWLVPDRGSEEFRRLNDLITEQAEAYGTPEFEPHVTVVGGVEAEKKRVASEAEKLAEEGDPFVLSLAETRCSTTEHQCVFVLVEPTARLLKLHLRASESVGTDEGMYVPHLSLVYGRMGIEERARVAGSVAESVPDEVRATAIEVVETGKPVEDWEVTERYPL